MELKDIRAIIDLMKKNDLAVFKLEKEGFKLELEAHRPPPVVSVLPAHQAVSGDHQGSGATVPLVRFALPASKNWGTSK